MTKLESSIQLSIQVSGGMTAMILDYPVFSSDDNDTEKSTVI